MPVTNATAAKRALIDALAALPVLAGVQVAYGYPARDVERELIYGGASRFTRTLDGMGGGMGGLAYAETVTVDLHIQVRVPGGTVEEAEGRTVELGAAVEEYLATHGRLDDLPGLLYAAVTGGELGYALDDDGVTSALQLQVEFTSYLT